MTKWNATDTLTDPPRRPRRSEIDDWTQAINKMSQIELASLRRFAPAGHVVFTSDELVEHFNKCFQAKGGMTPEISKAIGWGR